MGFIFSKPRDKGKKEIVITEQDKAVLLLKQQRDKLKQYQKKVAEALERDRLVARQLLQDGKKDRAKLLLRKKRFMDQVLQKTDGQLLNLERMVSDIEFAQIEVEVTKGLQVGNDALKKMHQMLSIDDIERIMDETQEGIEKQREIDELLSGTLTQEDEDAVMEELDQILAEKELEEAKEVEVEEPEIILPDVPAHEPKVPAKRVKKEQLVAS